MTHYIIKDYLRWFNNRIRLKGKKALLIMDNFSAHELAVKQLEEANELKFTKVCRSYYFTFKS